MNFFKNKNVVTIIAAIICILIISIAYKYRVDKKIDAITVPVASEDIASRTEITKKQINSMKVASSSAGDFELEMTDPGQIFVHSR